MLIMGSPATSQAQLAPGMLVAPGDDQWRGSALQLSHSRQQLVIPGWQTVVVSGDACSRSVGQNRFRVAPDAPPDNGAH